MSLRGYDPVLVLCSFDFAIYVFAICGVYVCLCPFCKSLSFFKYVRFVFGLGICFAMSCVCLLRCFVFRLSCFVLAMCFMCCWVCWFYAFYDVLAFICFYYYCSILYCVLGAAWFQLYVGNVIRTWICLTEATRRRSEHASWRSYFFFICCFCSVVFTLFICSINLSYSISI